MELAEKHIEKGCGNSIPKHDSQVCSWNLHDSSDHFRRAPPVVMAPNRFSDGDEIVGHERYWRTSKWTKRVPVRINEISTQICIYCAHMYILNML